MNNNSATANSIPLGIFANQKHNFLYSKKETPQGTQLTLDTSNDTTGFSPAGNFQIQDKLGKSITSDLADFRISATADKYCLLFKRQGKRRKSLEAATSDDLVHWQQKSNLGDISETGMLVPRYTHENKHVLYFGENSISIGFSQNLAQWEIGPTVLAPQEDFFGTWPLKVATCLRTVSGILLLYYVTAKLPKFNQISLQAALFDVNDPGRLLKKYNEPVWVTPREWSKEKVVPVGVVEKQEQLISFWSIGGAQLVAVSHPLYKQRIERKSTLPAFIFQKLHHNPILKPILHHYWESKATFNPAAFYAGDRVHLVYRAIGHHDVSVLGYAESQDGLHIDRREAKPIYIPTEHFEVSGTYSQAPHHSSPFVSGGGCFGGCEDPRITEIDDRLYMTYVAYDGWRPPRIALTSIKTKDFLNHEWNWETPVLISPPGVVDKNACILPEKINGKYVIFHRIFPNILIDFVDALDFDGNTFLKGEYKIAPRSNFWDSRKLGAGPPPIKTDQGWLLLYQAVDDKMDHQYKIGAMLLDLNDPTRVLHRTNKPFLEPTSWYENIGHKAGVAYPCGAVTVGGKLIMYYGGADTVVCAATAHLDEFLEHLVTTEATDFESAVPLFAN